MSMFVSKNSNPLPKNWGRVCHKVLGLIGKTPIVRLNKINKTNSEIWLKLEGNNPGGSIKDRIAKYMIMDAEERGILKKGGTIIEATSGNTGIGLAMIGAIKGYNVILVMPENVSEERKKILRAYGAKIILTPKERGTDGAIEKARELARENKDYVYLDQFNNPANVRAHYETTGVEIWNQTYGKITAFVAGIGTGGTIMGVAKRLKEYNQKIKIIGVEPVLGHKIQGLKSMKESYIPSIYDVSKIDEIILVNDEQAFQTARELAKKEGLLLGMSTGAAVYGALEFAKRSDKEVIVAISPDNGMKYLSTELYK